MNGTSLRFSGRLLLFWPPPPLKRSQQWLVGLISLALIALGIFAVVVGMHDVILRDEPLRVTTTGAVVTASGLVVFLAGVLLLIFVLNVWTIEIWSGRVILAACWLVAIGAAYLIIAEARSLTVDWRILTVAGFVAALAVAAFFYLEKLTLVTLGKVGVFLLGLVGTAFGVFQFWYQQEYLPTHKPPALSLTTQLEPAGERAGRELYKATITMKNTGDVKVIAFTGTYFTSGMNYGTPKKQASELQINAPLLSDAPDPYYARFLRDYRPHSFSPLAAGKLFAENRNFEPGDELSQEYVVAAPRCTYDLLSLRANIVVARGELLQLDDKPAVPRTNFHWKAAHGVVKYGVFSNWHVKDDSWIHDLVDGKERWIQIVQLHSPYGSPNGYFETYAWLLTGNLTAAQTIAQTERETHRLGLARTFADYELPVVAKNDSSAGSQSTNSQSPCPT